MKKIKSRINILPFLICSIILISAIILSLSFGARAVSFSDIIGGVIKKSNFTMDELVVHERIPRTILGVVAGCALALAGTLMQVVTRNPLADPGILGVNTGASLAIVIGISFMGIGKLSQYILFALVGAFASATFVYFVGSFGRGGATPIKLALAGTATTASLSSIATLILLPRASSMDSFRFWQSGGIGGATYEGIGILSVVLLASFLLCAMYANSLDILMLGDDVAAGLGIKTTKTRLIGAIIGVVLCGVTTALTGPIGFIGLVAPHIVRLLVGPNLHYVLPLSALSGASILLLADVIGRWIGRPGEIDAGLVAAFVGAPILVTIAVKSKVRSV